MAKVREAKITDFQPDPANPNKGSERGYRMLNDSLRKLGAGRSIVVDKNGYVIAGNKTQENAVDIGLEDALVIQTDGKQIVVVQRTDLDLLNDPEQKARHLSIADNRTSDFMEFDAEVIAALVDADMNLSDWFQQDELAELLAGLDLGGGAGDDPGADVDRAGELQVKWQTSRGQVWEIPSLSTLGRCHRVMCGDSTSAEDVARLMGGEKAALAFADPPYGAGVDTWDKEFLWDHDYLINYAPVVVVTPGIVSIFELARKTSLPYKWSMSCWISNAIGQRSAVGFGNWIYAAVFSAESIHRNAQDAWKIELKVNDEPEITHKGRKPTPFMKYIVETFTEAGDSALDPFLGSGTTIVACEQTGRIGYGMEIAPEYVAVILERLSGMGLAPRVVE